MLNFSVPKSCLAHPVEQPFKPGVDAIARLVRAVIRVAPEVVIELHIPLMQPGVKIDLSHRELVLVSEKYALGDWTVGRFHLFSGCQSSVVSCQLLTIIR